MYFHACLELSLLTPGLKQAEAFEMADLIWINKQLFPMVWVAFTGVVLLLSNYHFLSKPLPIMENSDDFYYFPIPPSRQETCTFAEYHDFLLGIACNSTDEE